LPRLLLDRKPSGGRRRRIAAHATALNNYRINRRRHTAGRWDLLPLYFIWTVHRTCNFRCAYCDDHRGRRYPDLPKRGTLDTDQGDALLRVMRSRTPSVYFAGGEPMLRADLPHLARTARDLRYFPIVVNTNGSVVHRQLREDAWRTWLSDTDIVVVSLDTLDVDAAGELWAHDRPMDVYRNLLLLRELSRPLGFKLMVNTLLRPDHLDQAADVLDLVNDLGICLCPVPLNVGPRIHEALPADPDYRRLTKRILQRKRDGFPIAGSLRMNTRLLGSAPKVCRNTLKPHIDHDGCLVWPCKSAMNVPPVKVRVLDFADVDALYAHAATLVDPTGFHGPAADQCGADCNWAQNYTTDTYAHGLEHPLSLVTDIAEFVSR